MSEGMSKGAHVPALYTCEEGYNISRERSSMLFIELEWC